MTNQPQFDQLLEETAFPNCRPTDAILLATAAFVTLFNCLGGQGGSEPKVSTTVALVPHATVERGDRSSSLSQMTVDQHTRRKKS